MDGSGGLHQVPVMYGDPNRQASVVLKKNTENTVPSAPFIACYIKGLDYKQSRLLDPTYVSKLQIREKAVDPVTGEYTDVQGSGYTVERIMPAPYELIFSADIWTTNTDQKLQIFEQISYFFNPAMELQTTDNYIDWTSLTVLYLKSTNWTSRQVPQGLNQDIDILNLTFETPIWITPPAKVMKMGVITKIITNVFSDQPGTIAQEYDSIDAVYSGLGDQSASVVVTPENYELMVLDNVASIIRNEKTNSIPLDSMPDYTVSWRKLLDLYPGQFRANLSQLRLRKADGTEVVAYISLDPFNEHRLLLNVDADTIPTNTIIAGRGTVDAIVDPTTYNPENVVANTRYLILEDINSIQDVGPTAWLNANGTGFTAHANDIIQWSGSAWSVVFNSQAVSDITYITNIYTGVQYKWDGEAWSKSFEGFYDKDAWRLVL
jgi:hypothetical protein